MAIEKLSKLMIDATGRGYYQADDADPDEAVTPYAKARAREDALLEALKPALSDHEPCRTEYELWSAWQYRVSAWKKAVDAIRQIEGSR
jgi:hypothetical protein